MHNSLTQNKMWPANWFSRKITEVHRTNRMSTHAPHAQLWTCTLSSSILYDHTFDDKSLEMSFCFTLLRLFASMSHKYTLTPNFKRFIWLSVAAIQCVRNIKALRDLFVALSVAINIWFIIVIYCKLEHVLSTLWALPSNWTLAYEFRFVLLLLFSFNSFDNENYFNQQVDMRFEIYCVYLISRAHDGFFLGFFIKFQKATIKPNFKWASVVKIYICIMEIMIYFLLLLKLWIESAK